jgi:hypothetical protein
MDMIGDQRPGKALGLRFVNDGGKPLNKIRAIGIGTKDLPAFDPRVIKWCNAPSASIRAFLGMMTYWQVEILNESRLP